MMLTTICSSRSGRFLIVISGTFRAVAACDRLDHPQG